MSRLGNVNVAGLDLSPAMRNDLAGGMSVTAFNAKYAGSGFRPIATSRQLAAAPAAAPPAAGPAPGGTGSSQEAAWNQRLTDMANQQKAEQQAMLDRQNAKQDGLMGQYRDTIKNQEQLPAMYQRLSQEAGLPEATAQLQTYKDQIYRTKDLLDRLDEDVTSRTAGTWTTEAMRRRIIADEGETLNTQLGRLGTGMAPVVDLVNGAQSQIATMMPLYMQQQDKELDPIKMEIGLLSDRFARELTGFSQNREMQLTVLMDEVSRGRQLADREWALMQEIAKEEREFQRQKQLAAAAATANAGAYGGGGGMPAASGGGAARSLPQSYVGNNDLRGRLNYLAQQGNANAKIALQYVGNDGKYHLSPYVTNPNILNALNSFGFTNVYSAPKSTPSPVSGKGIFGQPISIYK